MVGIYRGFRISSNPPPASGPQVIEILNILEGFDLRGLGHNRPATVALVARAMKASFADRARHLGDPRFVPVPVDLLTSKAHAAAWCERIRRGESIEVPRLPAPLAGHTTHVAVVDGDGSAVSPTDTLGWASGVATPGLGFTYNNCMFQFHPFPGSPNSIAPGKARITGIAPTLVFRDGDPFLVLGSPGGTRIIGAIVQVILNVIDHDMTPVEAVAAARFHCEGDLLEIEARLYYQVREALEAEGFRLRKSTYSYEESAFGCAQAILVDPVGARLVGASDPRGGGGVGLLD